MHCADGSSSTPLAEATIHVVPGTVECYAEENWGGGLADNRILPAPARRAAVG
jgi:hypothetical protein